MLAGVAIVFTSPIMFSCLALVLTIADRSILLGILTALSIAAGMGLTGYGLAGEWRGYRRLRTVDTTHVALSRRDPPLEALRTTALAWVELVAADIPEAAMVEQALRIATTPVAIDTILQNRGAVPLREAAMAIGRRAEIEAGTLIALSPHPSWDGPIAGLRGLGVIRQVARLHGLRPGPVLTVALPQGGMDGGRNGRGSTFWPTASPIALWISCRSLATSPRCCPGPASPRRGCTGWPA
jgi:putative membrane protein